MERYIKTEDAIPYLTKYIPSVEAVERSEIDKAIEDLKTEYCECKKSCSECIKNDHPYMCTCSIPLHEVLEFLNDRRNIGE